MNTNSLPVALMQSLVVSIPSLRWDEDDTKGAMAGRAFTYLALYSSCSMMVCLLFVSITTGGFLSDGLVTLELGCTPSFSY